ncbi:SGNH/GDSL hydrolase family protein [Bifidobacterium boum]|uniref:SGNH/GDSL hydrolase family protein n=2 Tax=Bifidobacterium boum TaxID=78343 RepID=A0A848D4W7_9BIFI|nr:SGNH/GDSL hydrolase family protein [Bifidobacterium boum]
MNIVAAAEALWAQHTIHLDPEPQGERHGVVNASADGEALSFVAVGDSMIAGCGVEDQSEGFTPAMASVFSDMLDRPVDWRAVGKLGATMRRVRYRLLPQVDDHADLMVLCAGSNDLMARRTIAQWRDDLSASLDLAKDRADHVVVFSAAQLYRSPSLGKSLRHVIEGMTDEQTQASREICERYGVRFLDMTHEDVHADRDRFYAHDRFHPSVYGYQCMAERVGQLLGGWMTSEL